jgi:hypothetical protein
MNPELSNKQYTEESLLNSTAVSAVNQRASEPKVERVLRWFEKKGNNLVGEKIITSISLEDLQKLFGISSENPMYDCYSVESSEQIDYLQNLLNFEFDTKSYEYFVECDNGE